MRGAANACRKNLRPGDHRAQQVLSLRRRIGGDRQHMQRDHRQQNVPEDCVGGRDRVRRPAREQSRSAVLRRRYRWRHKARSASRREAARAEEPPPNRPPGYVQPGGRARAEANISGVAWPSAATRESGKIAPSRCQRIPTAAGTAATRATRRRSIRARPSSSAAKSHKPPRPARRRASETAGWARPKREQYVNPLLIARLDA